MTRLRNLAFGALAVALGWTTVSLTGCKGTNPFLIPWTAYTDTVSLYSVADSTPNLYDGFDFVTGTRTIIERNVALGTWDVAVGTDSTGLVWMPPGAFGITSASGIAILSGTSYSEAAKAPSDTTKYIHTAVPITLGTTYVVRTRKVTDSYGSTCSHYAKVEPVMADKVAGVIQFIFDVNPNCGDLRLKP